MPSHSLRKATIGSIRVARRAGINIAIAATTPNTTTTPPNVAGSVGCTPYSIRAINFDSKNAPATACHSGKDEAGEGSARRDRNGAPWLSRSPGYLLCRHHQSIGRIYQQTFIDTYTKVAFAKLYDRKNALVAADMLNDRVLPFFEEQDVSLLRILTDRGPEYCGQREHHEYQLYLAVENIDHSRTRVKSPQTNGICERFHRTMQDEFYSVAFRKRLYSSLEQLQADLDDRLEEYNEQGPHSGKYCFGKTPMQTFLDSRHVAHEKELDRLAAAT